MRSVISLLVFLSLVFLPIPRFGPATFDISPAAAASGQLTLVAAEVCESVDDLHPQFPAIVFSIALGKISCFSAFDPVPVRTQIYHSWYYRDKLMARIRLTVKPPNWATFSTIQLRESDIGPWRVEITDRKGTIFKVLRFSVVE